MTVLDIQVESGPDDGYVYPSLNNYTPDSITLGFPSGTAASIWCRFITAINLKDASLDVATLQMRVIGRSGSLTVTGTISADPDSNPSSPISLDDFLLKGRSQASTEWTSTFPINTWQESPTILPVIEEVVEEALTPPTAIQLFIEKPAVGGSINNVFFQSYESDSLLAPILHLEGIFPNAAPEITVAPTVSYGTLTRTGPENSPAVMAFEAEDAEQTGADELSFEVRTASSGGGTLVASGDCTSGVQKHVNIAHNAPGLIEGSNTLYLRVSDGVDWSDDEPFTVLVDRTAPTVGAITHDPSPVTGGS